LATVASEYICEEKEVNLTALDSRLLEHFFAEIRFVAHGHDNSDCFERNVIETLLMRDLKDEFHIPHGVEARISDRGVKPSIDS
jgi:hypothetical protein